jgi:DNA-binding transcriptional MerR regulator/methylmalonyl-CoA mutase cobalamin-binding subunit
MIGRLRSRRILDKLEPSLMPPSTPAGLGIRAVAQMTGVDEHTLRIWERRYGFPHPMRTEGGTRLYSPADVHKLKLVQRALERGHRPSEVVARDAASLEALLQVGGKEPPAVSPDLQPLIEALRREEVDVLRAGLRQLAFLLGPRRFVVDVAQPLALRVGELWEAGELEVHHEHLMSDCLSTQLRVLRSFFDDSRGPVVLLATLPDERHGLGLEMIGLYLATAGLVPRVIGVSTPREQIVRAARAHRAAVVGLSVMLSSDLAAAAREIRAMLPQLGGIGLWVGGGGAPRLPAIKGVKVISTWPALESALDALPRAT